MMISFNMLNDDIMDMKLFIIHDIDVNFDSTSWLLFNILINVIDKLRKMIQKFTIDSLFLKDSYWLLWVQQ